MEAKDFTQDYLYATLIAIKDYDKVILNILYPTGNVTKECTLFRVTRKEPEPTLIKNVLDYLDGILKTSSNLKIKTLVDRRKSNANNELVILYSLDIKNNINDQILKKIVRDFENSKMADIISKLRTSIK